MNKHFLIGFEKQAFLAPAILGLGRILFAGANKMLGKGLVSKAGNALNVHGVYSDGRAAANMAAGRQGLNRVADAAAPVGVN